jgi:hypothetical protein
MSYRRGAWTEGLSCIARGFHPLVVAALALTGAVDALAQGPRTRPPPSLIIAEVEADRARESGSSLPIPPTFASEVSAAEGTGERLFVAASTAPSELSDAERTALRMAETADVDRCDGLRYRAIALPTKQGETSDREVYLLGEAGSDDLVVGRHFRVLVSPDGMRVRSTEASAPTCLRLPPVSNHENSFPWATHVLGCAPSTLHVYLSYLAKGRIYIRTSVGTWRITAGRIAFILTGKPCSVCSKRTIPTAWSERWFSSSGTATPVVHGGGCVQPTKRLLEIC